MTKVRLISTIPTWMWNRQLPSRKHIWKNLEIYFEEDSDRYDWCVVYEGIPNSISINCKNTILITGEPSEIKKYNSNFLKQFDHVISSQRNIKHPSLVLTQQSLPWMIGMKYDTTKKSFSQINSKDYDDFKLLKPKKNKLLSAVISAKNKTPGHHQRLVFAKALKKTFKNKIDIFGIGFNTVEDKWDAIAPYKYHVAIENSSIHDYWTEKLADAFLGGSYPIYSGCKNIYDYFPQNSLSLFDVYDINRSINQIKDLLKMHVYEENKAEINHAKMLVLDQYNVFPMIASFISSKKIHSQTKKVTLLPEKECVSFDVKIFNYIKTNVMKLKK